MEFEESVGGVSLSQEDWEFQLEVVAAWVVPALTKERRLKIATRAGTDFILHSLK